MTVKRYRREEIRARRKEVAELYLKGWFQADIAEKFGVSQQMISYDLRVIYKMWRSSAIRDFDKMREVELLKINNLERTYWEAWRKSREDWNKERERYVKSHLHEVNKEAIKENGDARYLQGVQWCINKRCELLGLNEAIKIKEEIASYNIDPFQKIRDNSGINAQES